MLYHIDYEVCTLIFLIIISVHNYTKKHLPSMQDKYFSYLLITTIVNIVLDVITAYTISYTEKVPLFLNYFLNSLYFVSQFLLSGIIIAYIYATAMRFRRNDTVSLLLILIPCGLITLAAFANMFTPVFFGFYPDAVTGIYVYRHTDLFLIPIFVVAAYLAAGIVLVAVNNKRIERSQSKVIIAFLLIILVFMPVMYFQSQLFGENYLLTELFVGAAVVMLYITLQNPMELLDSMTGSFNDAGYQRYLRELFARGAECNIISVAIDGMRVINNTFGVDTGNAVIVECAKRIEKKTKGCCVFRSKGDTFVVISRSEKSCADNLHALQSMFMSEWTVNETPIKISACICYAYSRDYEHSVIQVQTMLEHTMTDAKKAGRGVVCEIDRAAAARIQRQIEIESSLKTALANNEIEIYFQPIYSTELKRFTGAEALMRFFHKKLGPVSPDEFIPIAERCGMIVALGDYLLDRVCYYIRNYGLDRRDSIKCIEINLSAAELMQKNQCDKVVDCLRKYNISDNFLRYEITETLATNDTEVVRKNMSELRGCGFEFALDDFGTGYANLDSIMHLPFAIVKIDKTMLNESFLNEKSAMIFESIVGLIHKLGMDTVVEGVETAFQATAIAKMKVEYIQGFFYAKPMPVGDFAKLIEEQENKLAAAKKPKSETSK